MAGQHSTEITKYITQVNTILVSCSVSMESCKTLNDVVGKLLNYQ